MTKHILLGACWTANQVNHMPIGKRIASLCSTFTRGQLHEPESANSVALFEDQKNNKAVLRKSSGNDIVIRKREIDGRVSRNEKVNGLLNIIFDLKESKEAVYGALDSWVAWERNFPVVTLKLALLTLEKQQEWHKVIQVIKWMLSKGQCKTMGTYGQLVQALEKDRRADEAHELWVRKIASDFHSVPWVLCSLMISMYSRNNMLPQIVTLFKNLEAFDRKPPNKSIVQKVADAYEALEMPEERHRVLQKYGYLFSMGKHEVNKKRRRAPYRRTANSGKFIRS